MRIPLDVGNLFSLLIKSIHQDAQIQKKLSYYICTCFSPRLKIIINILWRERFNTDGQQFYQYQQSEQSSLTLTHCRQKRRWHATLKIQVRAWDRHRNVAELNLLIGSQHSLLDNCIHRGYFIIFFLFFVSDVIPPSVTQHVPKVATVDTEYATVISKY